MMEYVIYSFDPDIKLPGPLIIIFPRSCRSCSSSVLKSINIDPLATKAAFVDEDDPIILSRASIFALILCSHLLSEFNIKIWKTKVSANEIIITIFVLLTFLISSFMFPPLIIGITLISIVLFYFTKVNDFVCLNPPISSVYV